MTRIVLAIIMILVTRHFNAQNPSFDMLSKREN